MRDQTAYLRLAAALAALIAAGMLFACGRGTDKGQPVEPRGDSFRIDASGIKPGEVRFFKYPAGGKAVLFFVARTPGGELKTAFDACITCYPHKKGYVCESGRVVCVYCGTAFELDELGVGKGNCVPIQIEHTLEGDYVVIKRADVVAGSRWF